MCTRHHQLLLFALLLSSCDPGSQPSNQGPVIEKDGQRFRLSEDNPNVQVGATNEVRLSSRAQIAGQQLRETEWWVAREVVERQPRWDGLTEPPLTTQKACALALPEVKRRFPEVQEWLVHTIYARNLLLGGKTGSMYSYPNTWVYEIEFSPKDAKLREKLEDRASVHGLTQVVLLDGTVVPPRVLR